MEQEMAISIVTVATSAERVVKDEAASNIDANNVHKGDNMLVTVAKKVKHMTLHPPRGLLLRRGSGNGSNSGNNGDNSHSNYNNTPVLKAAPRPCHNKDTDCQIEQGRIIRLAGRQWSNMF